MQVSSQEAVHVNPFGEQFRTFHFYPSESHKKVVHRITRGLECNCGLILLTGEIGIGKTSVCRYIVQSFGDKYLFAESGNPFFKPAEQLYTFCKQFGIDTSNRHSISDLTEGLHEFFLQQAEEGKKPVIIIDESHLLAAEHFSLLLVLSNMRFGAIPLVQIILIGQVEIMDRLKQPGLEALNQRIGVRCELFPLNKQETSNYIQFKLDQAEFPDTEIFESKALGRIWHVTGGLPRLINHISSHALDSISFSGAQKISSPLIDNVASDPMYQGLFTIRTKKQHHKLGIFATAVLLSALLLWSGIHFSLITLPPITAPKAVVAPSADFSPKPVHPKLEDKILNILPQMPPPPEVSFNSDEIRPSQSLTVATNDKPVSVVVHDIPAVENTAPALPAADEKILPQQEPYDGQEQQLQEEPVLQDKNTLFSQEILDEPSHPAIEALQIDAVAWSEDSESRMVVIGNQILHEGDQVGSSILKTIERDYLIFSLGGVDYKKIGRK